MKFVDLLSYRYLCIFYVKFDNTMKLIKDNTA
jgi:hypothetical protein